MLLDQDGLSRSAGAFPRFGLTSLIRHRSTPSTNLRDISGQLEPMSWSNFRSEYSDRKEIVFPVPSLAKTPVIKTVTIIP